MRLTFMTDYAFRMLIHVARHDQRRCTIAEIAQEYGLSQGHLMKVAHQLGKLGWLRTVRGKGGGICLACAPEDIRLGDVVVRLEPDLYLVECLGEDNRCGLSGDCQLTHILGEALRDFIDRLNAHTLRDLVRGWQPVREPVPAVNL